MKIFVVNAGSSSLKFKLYEMPEEKVIAAGIYERIGLDEGIFKIEYKNGNVYINKDQYFEAVPEVAWNFFIGGYQPLQKYLKDRKGKNLSAQEIMHYQRIVVALLETAKIMEELN